MKLFIVALTVAVLVSCTANKILEDAMVTYLSKNEALNGKAEIVFLLDRSGSVGATNFEVEKGFIESFLTHIVVNVNASRVAVISYSDSVVRHIDYLQNPKTKCFLSQELQDVVFQDSGATNIAAAIDEAGEVFKNARPNVNKVLVLISDGWATRGGDPVPNAKRLKNSGVQIFCFGIGRVLQTELEKLASSKQHVFSCAGFQEFKKLAKRIRGDPHELSWSGQESMPNCDHLCDSPYKGESIDPGCCDHDAKCSCALLSGRHTCICGPGYYGLSGLMGQCKACPIGAYKSKLEPTQKCTPCPSGSTTSKLASKSIKDCQCKEGYVGDPSKGPCTPVKCPPLQAPTHGYLLGICKNDFRSECHFMCEEGFELLDRADDIRTCQSNGQWSGKMPTCGLIRCPALPPPTYGRKKCMAGHSAVAGTKCKFNCLTGFQLYGSEERECLPSKRWSGTATVCKPITCNLPPPISHGQIFNCGTQDKPTLYQTCLYHCNAGFKLNGPQYLICRENGKLSDRNKKELVPVCEDITPPEIVCPPAKWFSADRGRAGTTVHWEAPLPTDNSGIPPKLFTTPMAIMSPSYFTIGKNKIKYTAVDHAGLPSHCEMTIYVMDEEPPAVISCPANIEVSSNDLQEPVTWEEPIFEDNSGKPLKIDKNRNSGDKFSVGRQIVSYRATDESGNEAWCIFDVLMRRTTCPYYPAPTNGAFACNDWLYGKFCQAYCNIKHDFVESPAKWYICNAQSQWQTIPPNYPVPWPNCARPTFPAKIRIRMKGFYYNGDCNNPGVQKYIKKMFLFHFSSLDETEQCVAKGTCSLQTVKVLCGKITDLEMPRRKKRDVWSHAEREELELEFEIILNDDQELNDTDAVLQNFLETIQNLKWELDEDLNLQTTTLNPKFDSDSLNQTESPPGKLVLTEEKTSLICKSGSILNDNICVACAPGTFYKNSTQTCEDCPVGYYQDLDGQLECQQCPDGMNTLYERSRNESDCKSMCQPGTYSATGLGTCMACPINTFQENVGQKMCEPCSESQHTASIGSMSSLDCKDPCEPGTSSESGLVPCTLCQKSYYQPLSGQRKCIQCPTNFSTISEGANSLSQCFDLDPCSNKTVCFNGGHCKRIGRDAMCLCEDGYEGLRCEKDINECNQEPCFNNGLCVNVDGSFYCNCTSGFSGSHCENEVDECTSSPCLNQGTCLDKVNSYECLCPTGYEGFNCETKLELCYHDIICLNGGICKNNGMSNDSFCECASGYSGIDCSVDINECDNITCYNNGSCMDLIATFSCSCAPGFTGLLCETDIDECQGNQCSSGSTCKDLVGGYQCVCLPGYSGTYCENRLDDNFILNFPESSATIANMATMTLKSPLSDVTVSMWLQTTDTEHSGTPLSYAVASSSTSDEDGHVIDNALTISDCSGIQIYVNNEPLVTDVQVADGQWHHLAFTWSSENSGEWVLYKDGELKTKGSNLQSNGSIDGGGTLVIGQEQDNLGGEFSPMETFIGNITRLNVWNRAFSKNNITRLCNMDDDIPEKVMAWPDVLQGIKGNVNIIRNETPFTEIKNYE